MKKFLLSLMMSLMLIGGIFAAHSTSVVTVDGVTGIKIDGVFLPINTNEQLNVSEIVNLYDKAKAEKGFLKEINSGIKQNGISYILNNFWYIISVLLGLIALFSTVIVGVLSLLESIFGDKYPIIIRIKEFFTLDFMPKLITVMLNLFKNSTQKKT